MDFDVPGTTQKCFESIRNVKSFSCCNDSILCILSQFQPKVNKYKGGEVVIIRNFCEAI